MRRCGLVAVIVSVIGMASAVGATQPRAAVVSLDELRQQAEFTPVIPLAMIEGYALTRIEVARAAPAEKQPSRQAIRFVYEREGYPAISLIEKQLRDGEDLDFWGLYVSVFTDLPKEPMIVSSQRIAQVECMLWSAPPINADTLNQLGVTEVLWTTLWDAARADREQPASRKSLPILKISPEAGALWKGKEVSPRDLLARCRFSPLLPKWLPSGYQLARTEIVWVVWDQAEPKLPARQAVRFIFQRPDGTGDINVIETKHLAGRWHRNVSWTMGQGYFADWSKDRDYVFAWGTVDGIDFFTVSKLQLDCDQLQHAKQWGPFTAAR